MDIIKQSCENFNKIYFEIDEIYHEFSNLAGLTDTAMWILNLLSKKEGEQITQTGIIKEIALNKQTVNTTIRKLIEQDLVSLVSVEGNRKNKVIVFTEKGKEFNEKYMRPMIACEQEAFAMLKPKEQTTLLALYQKYVENLKTSFSNLGVKPKR